MALQVVSLTYTQTSAQGSAMPGMPPVTLLIPVSSIVTLRKINDLEYSVTLLPDVVKSLGSAKDFRVIFKDAKSVQIV